MRSKCASFTLSFFNSLLTKDEPAYALGARDVGAVLRGVAGAAQGGEHERRACGTADHGVSGTGQPFGQGPSEKSMNSDIRALSSSLGFHYSNGLPPARGLVLSEILAPISARGRVPSTETMTS